MRRWKEQAKIWKAMAEALERRAERAEAELASCTRSRDDPAVGFLAQLQRVHEERTEMKQQIRRLRTTLVAIVRTRDCDQDNVWQQMARAALDGTEHPQLQNEDIKHA